MERVTQNSACDEDIAEAARLEFGTDAVVSSWSACRSAVQGVSALILRVTATLLLNQEEVKVYWVAKVEPEVPAQLTKVREEELLQREGHFFSIALPLLQSRCSRVPVVRCVLARPRLLLLEELHDYVTLHELQPMHTRLVLEQLAVLHAASLDIDWPSVLPQINNDCVFESRGRAFFKTFQQTCSAYAEIITEFRSDLDTKYSAWLKSSDAFETLVTFIKPDVNNINVLNHGDFWLNNIMFKLDKNSKEPEEVKFIDFPACRYVPPSRDILNLLYTCTDFNFRQQHEEELLSSYVDSFNATLGSTRLSLHELRTEYESSRLYGVCLGLVFHSLSLLTELYPRQGEHMTDTKYTTLASAWHGLPERCRVDSIIRTKVLEMVDEFVNVLDGHGVK